MKKKAILLLSILFNMLVTAPNAYAELSERLEVFCSNSQGSIVYHVTDSFDRFTVLKDFSLGNGLQFRRKEVIQDIDMKIIEERDIESSWTSSCDDEGANSAKGIKTLKNLSLKKVLVTKNTGEVMPEGIDGLSDDGKTLAVEYFCDERIREEVACE